MRRGERDGVDYYFLPKSEIQERIEAGEFVEYLEVYGNIYGTLKSELESIQNEGKIGLMDVNIRTLLELDEKSYDCNAVFVFPPSIDVLE
jgi:guanylate kinase